MLTTLFFLFSVIVAYLLGSICSAVIVCQLFDLPDPRTNGSNNPGATNVLRLAGRNYAALVLVGDMLKGLLPVLLAKALGASAVILGFTTLAAVLGHMYPFFFDFKGGKGVATAMGALLGFHFILGVMVIATWLVVVNFTRYVSLASVVAIVLAPFYSIFAVGSLSAFLPIFIIAILVVFQHRDNITRLMDGTEKKMIFKETKSSSSKEHKAPPRLKATKKKSPAASKPTTKVAKPKAKAKPKTKPESPQTPNETSS